jgi:heat shock protein HslJ
MTWQRCFGLVLTAVLTAGLTTTTAAQDVPPTGPEGVDWQLTGYVDDSTGEMVSVPLGVQATLRLEGGRATGSGGCNQFDGGYTIDGTSLSFDAQMSVTLSLCDDTVQAVEDAYLAALPKVDGWLIDGEVLELTDSFGEVLLTLEVPHIMLTTSQLSGLSDRLAALQSLVDDLGSRLEALRADTEALNVPRLRDRIKALETANKDLTSRLTKLEKSSTGTSSGSSGSGNAATFTAAEQVLLSGIPSRISRHCKPLRSSLPKGTRAAVTCTPATKVVTGVDYYLLEGAQAASEFGDVMSTFNVPDAVAADQTCEQGIKSQRRWIANRWQAEGCFRTNKQAEVRFIENATDCRKLKVGNNRLNDPAIYMALQGSDQDVASVWAWATRGVAPAAGQLTSLVQPIPSDLGTATSCPS